MTTCARMGGRFINGGLAALLAGASLLTWCGEARAINEGEFGEGGLLHKHAHFAPTATPDSPDYRQYAPSRKVDILNLALDVTPDFKKRSVAGQAVITFKPIAAALDELRLDAVDLDVSAVTASAEVLGHQVTDSEIVITFAKPIPVGKETTVTIKYSAGAPARGLYFRTPEMGYKAEDTQIWTQGESDEARHWYPCFDYPNEKFSSEITCRVPQGMVVLSNGRKVSETTDGGLTVVHWKHEKPHVNYLLTLVAGYFKKVEDKHRDIPLEFWVSPSDINEAPNSFKETKAVMEFFEKETGVLYPWNKYGQVCVRDFHWGGMENTTLTTLTDRTLNPKDVETLLSSEGLVAHELAHQWFGDLVTCKDWSQAWLNEGFATYYTHLFTEHRHGRDEMIFNLYNDGQSLLRRTNYTMGIVSRKYTNPDERFREFGHLIYGKGSWVLHMLRSQLGPETFRASVKKYLDTHQYDTVVTHDLLAAIEEVSGRSYDQFFDQWVHHAHHPELEVSYAWDERTKLAKVTVKQVQRTSDTVALFNFPVTLRFKSKAGGTVDHRVTVKNKDEDFYCSLTAAPEIVRFDPELSVLAKVNFRLPNPMLYAQLADQSDMLGRVLAIEQLSNRKDGEAVAKLKNVLNNDPFYGVRSKASEALRNIHTDEALAALVASTKQSEARVRTQVVGDIGGFYSPVALDAAKKLIETEKNPVIKAGAIRTLGAYGKPEVREVLLKQLASSSYRERLAQAALAAIRSQDDAAYVTPVQDALKKREAEFPTPMFATGLDTLAYLSRNEEKKDGVREFLLGYVNHPKDTVQVAAINALGTLDDPKAIAALEKFTLAAKDSPERAAAERALASLNAGRKSGDNLRDLRNEVMELQKNDRELRKQLDDLKKKLDAKDAPAAGKKKK